MKVKAIHTVRIPAKNGFADKQPGEEFDLGKAEAEELIEMGAVTPVGAKPRAKGKPKVNPDPEKDAGDNPGDGDDLLD